jgi:CspA family cold shock protein
MNSGTIKWYNDEKGFGFIANDQGGDDVFIHFSAMSTKGNIREGQRVSFDTETDSKNGKLKAKNVSIIA